MKIIPRRVLILFLLFVIFCLHSTYLPNDFTWLDHGDIEAKRSVVSLSQLPQSVLTPFGATGFYRPLVTLFNSVDYAIYNSFAPGYHLTNVLLHIAVTAAVPLFLSVFFTFSFSEVLIILLIVGLHPLGWLPVGAISYRSELLMTFFVLMTVYFHAKAGERQSPFFAILATISFFCGLLAKETAIVLIPLLILLWELVGKHRKGRPVLLLYVPELLVVCLYVFMRQHALPQMWRVSYFQADWMEQIGTRIAVLEKLLWHFVSPLKPPLSDAVGLTGLVSWPILIGVLFCVALFFVWKLIKKQGREIKVALLLFGLLTPALNLIPVPRLGSPHYGYIALAAFAALVVLVLRTFQKRNIRTKRTVTALAALWIGTMAYSTVLGGTHFKNDLTLFGPEVAEDVNFREGYFYLGNYYAMNQQYPQAESIYKKSLQENPNVIAYHENTSAIINLALLKLQQGKRKEAKALFESILPLDDLNQTKKVKEFIRSL